MTWQRRQRPMVWDRFAGRSPAASAPEEAVNVTTPLFGMTVPPGLRTVLEFASTKKTTPGQFPDAGALGELSVTRANRLRLIPVTEGWVGRPRQDDHRRGDGGEQHRRCGTARAADRHHSMLRMRPVMQLIRHAT